MSPQMQTSERSPLLASGDAAASTKPNPRPSRIRELGLFIWALAATAAVIIIAVWAQHVQQTAPHRPPKHHASKRNLVFMVSDGMGPASLSLTRSFRQHIDDLPIDDVLTLDRHFWGTSRTRSSSSLVTDSAAGATAFSCGRKSYNGAISVTPDHEPCGSVLEAAKKAGYMTGLVATTAITDATPACFASHVLVRSMQDEIAMQEIGASSPLGRSVDLILGGGRCHFLPNHTDGGCREDDIDVVQLAQDKYNWTYAGDRKSFDALEGGEKVDLPILGLFAHYDFPFELDRRNQNDVYPSLSEMATTALRALEKATADSDKGFFIMIEGSRIDHAGHINDPAAQVHEVIEYDKAFKAVLDFIESSETETVLVATSDHETGGLATALQEPGHLPVYNWYPEALARANSSCEYLASKLIKRVSTTSETKKKLKSWINEELVIGGLGITHATDEELEYLIAHPDLSVNIFAAMISLRAHVGWSTHGHTALDVNIYSSGPDSASVIRGNVENTDVGKYLRSYLDVDVEEVTTLLRKQLKLAEMKGSLNFDAKKLHEKDYHSNEEV
ncbi:unnamed protein product [Clonostachys byssicola]|uniref:Alkaline phosphatase n=1 Tax=Clonostachys byssicola TaxID=160290 RepID=A0A9N9UML6_9HYPO|nr:unnamed protein product [Clonostachys byssicola]